MPPDSLDLALRLEQVATNMNKFSTLMAFKDSIGDKSLRIMLNAYPSLRVITEHSLQVGNIRRAEKYYVLLKRIEKEANVRSAICIKELEQKLIGE